MGNVRDTKDAVQGVRGIGFDARVRKSERSLSIGVIVILFLLPIFAGEFRLFQFTQAFCYWIVLLGLNLLVGYNGQLSLGHGAFYAAGAYTAAIMMNFAQLPYWVALPAAAVLCLVLGLMIGLPALRLEGHHLGLATFALAVAVPQFVRFKPLEKWTGGVSGLIVERPDPPAFILDNLGWNIGADRWMYYLVLCFAMLALLVARNLASGRTGRALVAIREHSLAARAMGINAARYKTLTFGVSALYAGVAGALSAMVVQVVSADSFTIFLSLSFITGLVIGGLASKIGPFIGAMFIQFIPNYADSISKAAPWAVYGVFLIVVIYLLPEGLAGGLRLVIRRVLGRLAASFPRGSNKP